MTERSKPPIEYEWVAQPGDARRYAIRFALNTLLRPPLTAALVFVVLLLAATAATGRSPILLAALIVYLILLPSLLLFLTYRPLRHSMQPGTVWVSGMDDRALLIGWGDTRNVVRYSSIKRITPRFGLVHLRFEHGQGALPAPLLPADAIARIRAKIQSA